MGSNYRCCLAEPCWRKVFGCAQGRRHSYAACDSDPNTDGPKSYLNHSWKAGRAASGDVWRRIKRFNVIETLCIRCFSAARRTLAFLPGRGQGEVLGNEDRGAAFRRIETEQDPRRAIRKLNLMGFALAALLICGVGGWGATSQLAGAVIAPGTIVVEF